MTIIPGLPLASETHVKLRERLKERGQEFLSVRIDEALLWADKLYVGRKHWTGMDLREHVLGVLELLLSFEPDEDAIIACILHHILDDGSSSLDQVQDKFGESVRGLVSGTHLLSHVTTRNRRMSLDDLRHMFLEVSDDVRVILLTLTDKSYTLAHLSEIEPEERRRICRDALTIFAPVAARLGIYALKTHMESQAFPVLYPVDAQHIAEQRQVLQEKYGEFLPKVASLLEKYIQESGVQVRVECREKHPYSIFRKMQSKSISTVSDLYDLFALRVIVESPEMCYQTLGLLHKLGHPVAYRFKDYIAFPKPNGYQSLHTTLAQLPGLPQGVAVEVQVRTEAMHREAEFGIAAHWSYKESGGSQQAMLREQVAKALSFAQDSEAKSAALHDRIFVLTPKGDVIELPEGATPLDFAFHVHTNLGLSFRAARVNGMIVPITYELQNGDIVEILRFREPQPSPRWSSLLKTPAARSRLKRYLASQDRPTFISIGRELLNAELSRRKMPSLDPDLSLLRRFDDQILPLSEREDMLMKIGQGSIKPSSLFMHLTLANREAASSPARKKTKIALVLTARVEGKVPLPIRYAKCCRPEEKKGKPIIGVVSRMGSVRVHSADCKLLKHVNKERRVGVRWE